MPCSIEMINRRENFPSILVNELAEPALINAVAGQEGIAALPSGWYASLPCPTWLTPKRWRSAWLRLRTGRSA